MLFSVINTAPPKLGHEPGNQSVGNRRSEIDSEPVYITVVSSNITRYTFSAPDNLHQKVTQAEKPEFN